MKKRSKKIRGEDVFAKIAADRELRRQIAYESHYMFFVIYFPNHLKFPMAEFQKEILRITEDRHNRLALIVAFRGGAKSTLSTFSYPLWAILGVQQKKFILIICQTQAQARYHMANLKHDLEHNALLKSDMGPFREESGNGEWALSSLVFKNTGARITIASVDQSIRGIRHREHRPDVIILDDIEDIHSVKTFEGRNKVAEWYAREVVPLGDIGTRIIILANVLHQDSFVMRLKQKIDNKELRGTYKWFPLLDDNGVCLWPEKFDTPEKIEALRQSVTDEAAWQQEYLLRPIADLTQVVHPSWIHYYDQLPPDDDPEYPYRYTVIGIDVAISDSEKADCTAMVVMKVYGYGDKLRVYVLPNPVNERLSFPEQVARAKLLSDTYDKAQIVVEDVGYQRSLIQQLERAIYPVEGMKVYGQDKRARLAVITPLLQNYQVFFPKEGAKDLINQLVYFGSTAHDDLADAFAITLHKIMGDDSTGPVSCHGEAKGPDDFRGFVLGEGYRRINWLTEKF